MKNVFQQNDSVKSRPEADEPPKVLPKLKLNLFVDKMYIIKDLEDKMKTEETEENSRKKKNRKMKNNRPRNLKKKWKKKKN